MMYHLKNDDIYLVTCGNLIMQVAPILYVMHVIKGRLVDINI